MNAAPAAGAETAQSAQAAQTVQTAQPAETQVPGPRTEPAPPQPAAPSQPPVLGTTTTDRLVPFAGPGEGTGPLTWGQQAIWEVMRIADSSRAMGAVVPLTDGKDADDLASELAFFMSRYESMRTRLRLAPDGAVTQVVDGAGEAVLKVVEVADAEDPLAVAQELSAGWQATKFDYEREWPMRMAAVRHRGVWTHVVVCLSHLAADGVGVGVMMREMAERDRATNQARSAATSMSPLELAARQAEPAARRLSEVSLRYWEQTLRQIAPVRFAAEPDAGRPEPRYRQAVFRSEALRMAARVVGARTGGPLTPVILGAYLVMLARVSGVDPVVVQGIVANRFRPGLSEATHPLCQNGILVVEVGDAPLDEVVDRAQRASLRASKNAYFNPDDHAEMLARVDRERGVHVDIACLFNARDQSGGPLDPDPLPTEAEVLAARERSVLSWGPPMDVFPEKAMLNFEDSFGAAELLLEADTHYVPAERMVELLRGMEEVVVEAAFPGGHRG